jgi:hypothetical protein
MMAAAPSATPVPADMPVPDMAPREEYAASARAAAVRRTDPVRLRYMMTLPISIRGSASGREYQFSSSQSIQLVDPRDAAQLLQSRMFRQFA